MLCYMDNYLLSTGEESETQRLNNFSGNIQLASGEQGGKLGVPDYCTCPAALVAA